MRGQSEPDGDNRALTSSRTACRSASGSLRHRPHPGLDRIPIFVEAADRVLSSQPLNPNVRKPAESNMLCSRSASAKANVPPTSARAQERRPRRPRRGGGLAAPGGTRSTRVPDWGRTAVRVGTVQRQKRRCRKAAPGHRPPPHRTTDRSTADVHRSTWRARYPVRRRDPPCRRSQAPARPPRRFRLKRQAPPRTGGHFGRSGHRRGKQPRPTTYIAVVGRFLSNDHGRLSVFGHDIC